MKVTPVKFFKLLAPRSFFETERKYFCLKRNPSTHQSVFCIFYSYSSFHYCYSYAGPPKLSTRRISTTIDIKTLSIMAEHCNAERHLCWVSFTLSVTNKPFMLSVVMLNVASPSNGALLWYKGTSHNDTLHNDTPH